MKFNFPTVTTVLFLACWVLAIAIAFGPFGNHPDLFTAVCGIGAAIGVVRAIKNRKNSESECETRPVKS